MTYTVPKKYFYRLHHVRPRFKNNVEAVLLYMADVITSVGCIEKSDFKKFLIEEIYKFPGNSTKKLKTIQNWRTEIAALFSLYYEEKEFSIPSDIAKNLSLNQDLTKFFKYFLYSFQYPAGHIKPKEIVDLIKHNIQFHPTTYFLKVIRELKEIDNEQAFLTKGEACHMIYNDLRAITDSRFERIQEIAQRIYQNRKIGMKYDLTGDVIRYAGDTLDYMTLGNLVKNYAGKYFTNSSEERAIKKILEVKEYFKYEGELSSKSIVSQKGAWVKYVTEHIKNEVFETNVLAFIAKDEKDYKQLQERTAYIKVADIPEAGARTKDIGDYGESLVYGHECMSLKLSLREDLIKWVQCIPNHLAVGYDIQSVNKDETKKYIEVKSTISSKMITFNRFKLTKNELSSAQTLGENYFVYRLKINKVEERTRLRLSIIKNPIKLFKDNEIDINLSTGEVNMQSYEGIETELLDWKDS